jgi:hypothetical protein
MNFKINITDDGHVYNCTNCPYRDRDIDFCGFCLRKILDEWKKIKGKSHNTEHTPSPQGQALSGFFNARNHQRKGTPSPMDTKNHTHNRWAGYYFEDTDCCLCIYSRGRKRGCSLPVCCCGKEKKDALTHNRIHRKPGSMRWYK